MVNQGGDILGNLKALPTEAVYTAQEAAARQMLGVLHSLETHIGRTDMAWTQTEARKRVDIENRLKEKARAAIAAARAAGIDL